MQLVFFFFFLLFFFLLVIFSSSVFVLLHNLASASPISTLSRSKETVPLIGSQVRFFQVGFFQASLLMSILTCEPSALVGDLFKVYLTARWQDDRQVLAGQLSHAADNLGLSLQIGMMDGAMERVQEQYLNTRLLAVKARKDGLDKGSAYTKKREILEMDLLVQTLLQREGAKLQEKSKVSDADVKACYEKNLDKFKTTETFTARQS